MAFRFFGVNPGPLTPEKRISVVKTILYASNLAIIVYLSSLMIDATGTIRASLDSRDFLELLQYAPSNPQKAGSIALLLYVVMAAVEAGRARGVLRLNRQELQAPLFILYLALSVAVMMHLNMSNKGILMIPAMHAILAINGRTQKGVAVLVVFLLYVLLDQDFISSVWKMVTLDTYIAYYPNDAQATMIVVRTLLNSVNEVVFLVFMITYIQFQMAEHLKIKLLNERLNRSLESLQVANVHLSEYSKKAEENAKLKERNRLAREIHDTIGHTLTGIEVGLRACLCLSRDQIDKVFSQVEKVFALAQKGSQDVRFSIKELRPDALQRYSLVPALETLVKQMNDCTKTVSTLSIGPHIPVLEAMQEELVYRIVQESMTNAVGHGHATTIDIDIQCEDRSMHISIVDNGTGIDDLVEGFGLSNIRRRVAFYDGSMHIVTGKDRGFALRILLPLMRTSGYD